MALREYGKDLARTRVPALLRGLLAGGRTRVARAFHMTGLGDRDRRSAFRGPVCSEGQRIVVIGITQVTSLLSFGGAERGCRDVSARGAD